MDQMYDIKRNIIFASHLKNTLVLTFLQQAAKEQTQDLIVKTNKLQGEK